MEKHIDIITSFYTAFQDHDAEKMVGYYSDDVVFQDPVFGELSEEKARNMWRMLLSNTTANKLSVSFDQIEGTEEGGKARWVARYVFGKNKRPIVNNITATFVIKNGKITKHVDVFDLHLWARQALGLKGWLLGGTNFFKKQIHAKVHKRLANWERQR